MARVTSAPVIHPSVHDRCKAVYGQLRGLKKHKNGRRQQVIAIRGWDVAVLSKERAVPDPVRQRLGELRYAGAV